MKKRADDTDMKSPHIPVLLDEVLCCFETMPAKGVFIDCTLGYGGHSKAILSKFADIELIGIDQDPEAISFSQRALADFGDRFKSVYGRFSDVLPQILNQYAVCGILADFGVSSLQLDKRDRGFSFHSNRLDMRMGPHSKLSAYDVVNRYSLQELERIFREYAEERAYKKAARAIVAARGEKPIESGKELADILGRVLYKRGKMDPATTLFQAIRMEVNDELGEIKRLLDTLEKRPPAGAVVGLITFHSLEDRIVKHRFRKWSSSCICPPGVFRCECGDDHAIGDVLSRKPLTATEEELRRNPRSRSAKLRCFHFKDTEGRDG